MIDFTCPQCPNHVRLDLPDDLEAMVREGQPAVDAFCCTRHPRPVRMLPDPPSRA